MKRKCEICHGKGGWLHVSGRFTVFVSCAQCKGKGVWFPNAKPKNRPKG